MSRSRILAVAVMFALLATLTGLGRAAPARVSITVTLAAGAGGTFRMSGNPTDSGRVLATRTVSRGRLTTRQTLTGAKGTLVLVATQHCGRETGTWRLVSGRGAYRGATGTGTTNGRIGCTRPFSRTTVVHTGSLAVPPPPLATPGAYRGWTSQDFELSFDVSRDGRALVNVLVGGYRAACVNQNGLRRDESSGLDQAIAGPVAIADDRSFELQIGGGLQPAKLSGRFTTGGSATGTIVAQYRWEAGGHLWSCAADVPWTVTTPAPPQRQAVAGKYCGVTAQGEGVCLDVPADGREFRTLSIGVPLVCGETGFLVRLTMEGPFRLRSDLSVETSFTQPLGADGSTRVFLSGAFDRAGSMTGRITLQQPAFTHEGVRYTCRNGAAAWTATRQS